ncbi:MAG: MgtC/SapB family protein [Deltaproteobacteria bacterium]
MPSYLEIARDGGMALLMGMLIGLERQHSQREDEALFAGVRTFPLIALIGFLAALVTRTGYPWVLPVALAGVCAMVVTAYWMTGSGAHKGATTEFVAILTCLFGVLSGFGYVIPAATFAVVTTLVLSIKAPLHQLAEKIKSEEMYAILKFGIVSVIILPLLPDRPFGPWGVLNPRVIWWMVVLISAISMVGYVLMRFLGVRQGIALTGLLGGLASSTATTLGLSQKARDEKSDVAPYFALGIVLASTIMFFRVLFLTWVVDEKLGAALVGPIAIPGAAGLLAGAYLWRRRIETAQATLEVKNPMELGSAIKFGLLFALVLLVARGAHFYFGSAGLFIASGLAGLTDVDAITISTARLAREGVLAPSTANAAILLAGAANTLVKGALAVSLGGRALRKVVLPIFSALTLLSVIVCMYVARG